MLGVPEVTAKRWTKESFDYYDKLLFGPEGGKAGVFQFSGYQLFNDDRQVIIIFLKLYNGAEISMLNNF